MKTINMTLDEFLDQDYQTVITPYHDREYDEKGFVITCPELPGIKVFEESISEGMEELREAKIAWYEMMEEMHASIPLPKVEEPPSGRLTLRLPVSLHEQVTRYADLNKQSLNNAINSLIAEGLHSFDNRAIVAQLKQINEQTKRYQVTVAFKDEGIRPYDLPSKNLFKRKKRNRHADRASNVKVKFDEARFH
ncbi:toxin-antitoxin system HicB family antitoxin [Bhargavaea cecembensis]|uniref:toxin-antitoxin system HicB family antitoxin n=1 Tax=Bhargavaea cecembensis TaxID=394098 RepID=UPI0015CF1FDC|nr:toxin-antitoxin system HicB family antitoxin [Bhargavaea cecembensis]